MIEPYKDEFISSRKAEAIGIHFLDEAYDKFEETYRHKLDSDDKLIYDDYKIKSQLVINEDNDDEHTTHTLILKYEEITHHDKSYCIELEKNLDDCLKLVKYIKLKKEIVNELQEVVKTIFIRKSLEHQLLILNSLKDSSPEWMKVHEDLIEKLSDNIISWFDTNCKER